MFHQFDWVLVWDWIVETQWIVEGSILLAWVALTGSLYFLLGCHQRIEDMASKDERSKE